MIIKCFMLEPTNLYRRSLRRYSFSGGKGGHNHDASVVIEDVEVSKGVRDDEWDHGDIRWAKTCSCGYEFSGSDEWQHCLDRLYERSDGKGRITMSEARDIPGAMWDITWFTVDGWKGPDGRCLCVTTPGGGWIIDSRSSNCTKPEDNNHRCWTRVGVAPKITVGKHYGATCGAGGGSVQAGNYHGFLIDGELRG